MDWTHAERRSLELIAKALVEMCVRNRSWRIYTPPLSRVSGGDYSAGKVVSHYGEIGWTQVSRISDEEMKALMMEVVGRVFTFLRYPEELAVVRRR